MLKLIEEIDEMREQRKKLRGKVGLVPTMGYLHAGHLALAQRAKTENKTVVVSIYVNPTQFGPKEDFKTYPRDLERDLSMLSGVGVDMVFAPMDEEMYPDDFSTWVDVEKVTDRLEGAVRPGHFKGVATVVAKLFNIVQPTKAYFGEKDAQQVIVIKRMVADLNMNLDVVIVPTVREADGLAMSSRNIYLNPEERKASTVLYKALTIAQKRFTDGERDAEQLRQAMKSLIEKEPLAKIGYISIAHPDSLVELNKIEGSAMASLAVRFGKTRLIDNITLGKQ